MSDLPNLIALSTAALAGLGMASFAALKGWHGWLDSVIGGILKSRSRPHRGERVEIEPENDRLRDEVRTLKERIAVLERIATDRTSSLDHEIEQLRDR